MRVLIVQPDEALAASQALDSHDLEHAADHASAMASAIRSRPDLLLVDIELPGLSGLTLMRLARRRLPRIRVLVYSRLSHPLFWLRARSLGASGYLLKPAAAQTLAEAVLAAAQGKVMLDRDLVPSVLAATSDPEVTALQRLTDREFEVLRLWMQGATAGVVAEVIGLSRETVLKHMASVRRRLGEPDAAQWGALRQRLGWGVGQNA